MKGTDGDRGIRVPAKGDRYGRDRKVFGVMLFTVKVAAQDSDDRLLVIEQIDGNVHFAVEGLRDAQNPVDARSIV